jgi:hypothetical protein
MTRSMEDAQKRLIRDFQKLGEKWFKELRELPQRWFNEFQQEMSKWTQDLLKDAFNPAKMMEFLRSMGLDPARLAGMIGQQPGFDPYQVLGLEKSASDEEVKKRFRQLMLKIHPDKAGVEGTNFLTQMVLAAYKMIEIERGWR